MGLLDSLGIAAHAAPKVDDLEKQMASGGLCPEGVHHAVLEMAGPIPNAEGRGWKLVFRVIAGPGNGAEVEDVLWRPKGEDAKKDAKMQNRVMLYGHRLGVLRRDDNGKLVEFDPPRDFCDRLGAACFIEVTHRDREYEKNGTKQKIREAQLTFEGVLSPDDKKVKDVAKATTLPVVAAGATMPTKDKFAGI